MTESKKEEKTKTPPPAKEAKPQEAAPGAESGKRRQAKISGMSLAEIEKALEHTQKNMGGLASHYARTLLARKAFLSGRKPAIR